MCPSSLPQAPGLSMSLLLPFEVDFRRRRFRPKSPRNAGPSRYHGGALRTGTWNAEQRALSQQSSKTFLCTLTAVRVLRTTPARKLLHFSVELLQPPPGSIMLAERRLANIACGHTHASRTTLGRRHSSSGSVAGLVSFKKKSASFMALIIWNRRGGLLKS
jgi:hypothetical protein